MKKILIAILFAVIMIGIFAQNSSAFVAKTDADAENFVFDEQGILHEFYVRDINIIGAEKYDKLNVRCLLYIPEKSKTGPIDLQDYAKNRLKSIGHGNYESVLVIVYSDANFAVAYSDSIRAQSVEKHIKHAREIVLGHLGSRQLGMKIMEAYSYLSTNIGMSPKYYLVKDPMREVKDFRSQMAMYSVLCFIIIALIWNIIMRWSKIIEIVVFLVCQALIIASSITMVLSNVPVTTVSIVLVVLTAANIIVVFSNFVGIMGLIGPKLSARINGG